MDASPFAALSRLDELLFRAVSRAEQRYGGEAAADPYRGLYVSLDGLRRDFSRQGGEPILAEEESASSDPVERERGPRWTALADAFALTPFDLDVLLVGLAPEVDLRYERIYAYLQDDVTKRWPSVDLALDLLCRTAAEKLAARARFGTAAPLVAHRLLALRPEAAHPEPPLLGRSLRLSPETVLFLLGGDFPDARGAPAGPRLEELVLPSELRQGLGRLAAGFARSRESLALSFIGPAGAGRRSVARAIAREAGRPLFELDLRAHAAASGAALEEAAGAAFRDARLRGAALLVSNVDSLAPVDAAWMLRALRAFAAGRRELCMTTSAKVLPACGVEAFAMVFELGGTDYASRRTAWEGAAHARGLRLTTAQADTLAAQFNLTPGRIVHSVEAGCVRARARAATAGAHGPQDAARPEYDDLHAAARADAAHEFDGLARKMEVRRGWNDIVLTAACRARLDELCSRAKLRYRVLETQGFGRKLAGARSTSALLAGPPGCGKTLAMEIIAGEIGQPAWHCNLAGIVSKYIGETEKNLEKVFAAAERSNAILYFDEADSLFARRVSSVETANDRWSNLELSYLLQRIEEYDGIAILATNLKQNIDEAFARRLTFTIEFPFPDEEHRHRIWRAVWPEGYAIEPQVDFAALARGFKLSGANIRNAALAAAFSAAARHAPVSMADLLHAIDAEYDKMGREAPRLQPGLEAQAA
jgi:AAA+ superfamily predicted ATPase